MCTLDIKKCIFNISKTILPIKDHFKFHLIHVFFPGHLNLVFWLYVAFMSESLIEHYDLLV